MERINEELARLIIKRGGNKAEIAKRLGITPQGLGNYERGRKIPVDVIQKWKKEFGDDLLKLSETTVSHETSDAAQKSMDLDVWQEIKINNEEIRRNNATFKEEIAELWKERHLFTEERNKYLAVIAQLASVVEPRKSQKG